MAVDAQGRPGPVAALELIESSWGNAVRDYLPVGLGPQTFNFGNVSADGSNVLIGTAFNSVNDKSTRARLVLVTWSIHWSGGSAPGHLAAYIKQAGGATVYGYSEHATVSGAPGSMTVAGGYAAGAGGSFACDLFYVLTGTSANVNTTSTIHAIAVTT